MYLPKILIGTPTYEGKNYCLEEFIDNVANFSYPRSRFDFVIFDNSSTPENAKYISKKYGVKVIWKDYSGMGVIEKLAQTHEEVRLYAINNNYDYLLHLESDVFPQADVIEQLLWQKKNIIGVPYQLFGGGQRRVVTQPLKYWDVSHSISANILQLARHHQWWFDGTVKRVSTNGIGCTLMKVKAIKNIPFRFVPENDSAPDTWFTLDLIANNVHYYVHTGMVAFHWNNEDWGAYANLLKYDKSE